MYRLQCVVQYPKLCSWLSMDYFNVFPRKSILYNYNFPYNYNIILKLNGEYSYIKKKTKKKAQK